MAIQISLFNHKGGVSKTTTAFNLGWMLAAKGKRVLLADCDPQCNLTGMVLGFKGTDDFSAIYATGGVKNIRDGLAPAFESRPAPIQPVDCELIVGQPNMHLIPGHIGLAEYEVTLGIAQELSGSLVTLQNLPGSLHHLFHLTAKQYASDFIIVDMSPSLGPINQNLLMTSDYFLVPMAPDYFSVMATDSLASVLPKWKAWAKQAQGMSVLQKATYPFPSALPRFLGTVIQKYRIREGTTPSAAFQKWIDEIEAGVKKKLIPALEACDMLLPAEAYASVGIADGKPLLQMSDFNGLIALSQKHKVPVFALTDAQLEQTGVVLERTRLSMQKFGNLFAKAADRIISLTEYAKGP
ncbi:ParA family protein [Ralstonia pseudosolanacearum]|uniref:CobQ/CobB/MinD/ParA nucleotide binding domain protein n=1 Tax=Ralstonia solanacearum TaxID=305 RepID=A0A0S4U1M0_RALSL|nr:transcriptional regulator [Ralstonia solanacearum]NKA55869.1 transcriptional regulator [Ralstonia solanacearum]NKA70170.1 transcriptional regulator [Ralstonia solanacearum]NKA86170.1 transcriptional regulator [Ralstonia solanacearum]NKF57474.1 transcriptional regulator [Ralstonia solanacearum]